MFAYFVEFKTLHGYCPSLSIELNFHLRVPFSKNFKQILEKKLSPIKQAFQTKKYFKWNLNANMPVHNKILSKNSSFECCAYV